MKYIVFGAGNTAEKIILKYWKKIEIKAIFDNRKTGTFYQWTIEKPYYDREAFCVVATERYYEVRKQLMELGYTEFKDFVPYQIFDKKMAVMYGNCHAEAIKYYLERNKEFAGEYGFYPFPPIQLIKETPECMEALSHCDLLLHQMIRKEVSYGEEYASVNILKRLSGKSQVISIPNLHTMPKCFFPQQKLVERKEYAFRFTAGEDVNIKKWLQDGKTEKEIRVYMENGGVYEKQAIIAMWEEFKEKLLEREKEWDIKISDYIMNNYKKEKLFYECFHISDVLVREIADRLLNYMGYETIYSEVRPEVSMDTNEMFIYKDVADALELEFEQKYIRINHRENMINKADMDMEEYVHQICLWASRPIEKNKEDMEV